MTTLTLDLPRAEPRPSLLDRLIDERRRGDCPEPRRRPRGDGERSLDELVTTAWSALGAAKTTACLVCGGDTQPRYGAGARPVAARCTGCGSELS